MVIIWGMSGTVLNGYFADKKNYRKNYVTQVCEVVMAQNGAAKKEPIDQSECAWVRAERGVGTEAQVRTTQAHYSNLSFYDSIVAFFGHIISVQTIHTAWKPARWHFRKQLDKLFQLTH